MAPLCRPDGRTAILSFQSHGDRSFLDDRILALASGEMEAVGWKNDLVLVVLDGDAGRGKTEAEKQLVRALADYDLIIYERVWSRELVAWLRASLPGAVFVSCRGEHVLDDPPCDFTLSGELQSLVPAFVAWVRGRESAPPEGVRRREGERFVSLLNAVSLPLRPLPYRPNLHPRLVNPEEIPRKRTFSLDGNRGCPYQTDARENVLYKDAPIPAQYGRGCAFCTTGNHYVSAPTSQTATKVLEQIRYVRKTAPELDALVLKDQNPFGYLTELLASCEAEGIGGFSLLLETRADWFLRNARRFERALESAAGASVRIAPFLIGIENFSQPELDRFNKGTTGEANVEFLETLWRWKDIYGDTLEFNHAAFGFVLFSPWTTMHDLRVNFEAIRRTRFDTFRGSVLHSRVRLYPDTALFYLAQRDGLLVDAFEDGEDNSRRYGYYPARPWRFLHPETERFATLAVELTTRTGSRNQIKLFECLLVAFENEPNFNRISPEEVLRSFEGKPLSGNAWKPVDAALKERFERLIRPISFGRSFAAGWSLGELTRSGTMLELEARHQSGESLRIRIVPRREGPRFCRSKHYDIVAIGREPTPSQLNALAALGQAIVDNDLESHGTPRVRPPVEPEPRGGSHT